ncbi:50S ribosomal protein L22 [bacterium]|nr:MAG: 50S ribosomal protein L22 [bacterium]
MKTQASIKYLKISARKLRLAADLVRDMPVAQAEQVLSATPKKAAVMVAEALKSAVANAENNHNARKSTLRIAEIKVDEGPTLKRFRPRSRGMAAPILHRMSHLTIVVTDEARVEKKSAVKQSKKTEQKQLTASGKEA